MYPVRGSSEPMLRLAPRSGLGGEYHLSGLSGGVDGRVAGALVGESPPAAGHTATRAADITPIIAQVNRRLFT